MNQIEVAIIVVALVYCAWHVAAIVRLVAGRARTPAPPRPPRSISDCVEAR